MNAFVFLIETVPCNWCCPLCR